MMLDVCYRVWLVFLLTTISPTRAQDPCTDMPTSGLFFRCEIHLFQDGEGPVYTRVKQEGYAGRPSWIQTVPAGQVGESLVLFGTPGMVDIGTINLVVTATRYDSEDVTRNIQLQVQSLQGRIAQISAFLILNFNLGELLMASNYSELQATLREVYPVQGGYRPAITAILDPTTLNIPVPQPPAKIGVMVQMTAGVNVTKFIHTTTEQGASSVQGNCTNSNSTLPPLNFNQFAARGFQINWCLYTLKYIEEITASETPPTIRIAPPIPRRNSVLTLIVIVAVMCVLLTMTLTGLTCFFFGRRKHSITVSKDRQNRNDILRCETKRTIKGVARAQVVLRGLSYRVPEKGLPLEENRPQSSHTGILEYQEVPDDNESSEVNDCGPPPEYNSPPEYHYNQHLITTRPSTPSN